MYRAGVGCAIASMLLLLGMTQSDAHAISRGKAQAVALKSLQPPKGKGNVVVFGLKAPLKRGQTVSEGGPPKGLTDRLSVKRLEGLASRQWVFWMDLHYGAKFAHESKLVLIDHRSGRVTLKRELTWWPLIDSRKPAFVAKRGKGDKPYRVYEKLDAPAFASTRLPRPAFARMSAVGQIPRDAFKDDCLIPMVDRKEFAKDYKAVVEFWEARGVRVKPVPPATEGDTPDGNDLLVWVKKIKDTCKDIIIYLGGHGSDGSVVVGEKTERSAVKPKAKAQSAAVRRWWQSKEDAMVRVATIKAILTQNPDITFKLMVDSCFAGHFRDKTRTHTNLLIVTTSSKADEKTWGGLFGVSPWTAKMLENMEAAEARVATDTSSAPKAARLIEEAANATTTIGPFFAQSTPQSNSHLPAPAFGGAQQPGSGGQQQPADYSVSATGAYEHPDPPASSSPFSAVCAPTTTSPAQPGGAATATLYRQSAGQWVSVAEKTLTLDGEGKGNPKFGIDDAGQTWKIVVTVTRNGVTRSGETAPFTTPFQPAQTADCHPPG